MLAWIYFTVAITSAAEPKTVLFVESGDSARESLGEFMDGFRSEATKEWGARVNIVVEHIVPGEQQHEEVARWLERKHEHRKIDLVAIFERGQSPHAIICRDRFWAGTPVLIAGVNAEIGRKLATQPNVTVVTLDQDVAGLLAAAWRLYPHAKSLRFASSSLPVDPELRVLWTKDAEDFAAAQGLEFVNLLARPDPEHVRAQTPPALTLVRENLGLRMSRLPETEALRRKYLTEAPGPVFSMWGHSPGEGAMATVSVNYGNLGADAGAQAAAIFRAGSASAVPVVASHAFDTIYDWRQMQRWHLDEKLLPAGSTVLFRPKGLWETHRNAVLGVLAVVAVQSILIALLLHSRRRARELNASLGEQRRELAHLSRLTMLSTLSGSLAHELNQPLGIILSNAQAAEALLEGDAPDLAEVRGILASIVKADHRAGEVIKRLRAFLKRGEPNRQPHAVNDIVEDSVQLARNDLITHGVALECFLVPGLPLVLCDRVQLQQVVLNLIMNASDAMVDKEPDARRITIRSNAAHGRVRISIRDNGCGLPADVESIFQPLVTTKKQGLGLGLAISRSIAESHGGKLWAEAQECGAVFQLEFPMEAEAS